MTLPRVPFALLALALPGHLSGQAAAQTQAPTALRGYTIMAGGLGRAPKDHSDMWSNTVAAHLDFIERAKIDLVGIEVPYGLSERYPKSPTVAELVQKLRQRKVTVWLLYPHGLAQAFDLPRQVGADGKIVDWNCCFNAAAVQDWLVENGKSLAAAYRPDALVLFGTFHVGGECRCETCRHSKPKSAIHQERFFVRLRDAIRQVVPETKIGTCDFWATPTKPTLEAIDIVCPVVPIFRPGYADAGQVTKQLETWKPRLQDEQVVPYVKVFLAGQTKSQTEDLLAAVRECCTRADGFLLWGYNPGHSYQGQDYDHEAIRKQISDLASKKTR